MIRLIRYIEFTIGDFLCLIASRFKRGAAIPAPPRSILIIRDWSLGESLLALPVLKRTKEHFPGAKITVLVTASSKPVFIDQPFIDKIITFNFWNILQLLLSWNRYDICLDMMPYFRHSALIGFWCSRFTVGFDTFPKRSALYDHRIPFDDSVHMVHVFDEFYIWGKFTAKRLESLHSREIQDRELKALLDQPGMKIGIHLGTEKTAPWRAWAFDNFRTVIESLLKKYPGITIFLSGSAAEADLTGMMEKAIEDKRVINLAGRINLFELAFLMKKLDLYVSNDTGPMHVSASMGCKTIGLFGPNTPIRFGPFPLERNIALYNPPPGYTPSINVHRGEFGDSRQDRKLSVVNRIRPETVISEIERALRESIGKGTTGKGTQRP